MPVAHVNFYVDDDMVALANKLLGVLRTGGDSETAMRRVLEECGDASLDKPDHGLRTVTMMMVNFYALSMIMDNKMLQYGNWIRAEMDAKGQDSSWVMHPAEFFNLNKVAQ